MELTFLEEETEVSLLEFEENFEDVGLLLFSSLSLFDSPEST